MQGIRGAFWALGAITLPVCLAGSLLLQDPPESRQNQQGSGKNEIDLSPWQMLKTKQYWLCAGAVCFSTPAVLLFSPIILKLGVERGWTKALHCGAWCWAAWAVRRVAC